MEQSQKNTTQLQATFDDLRTLENTAENKAEAGVANGSQDTSQAGASEGNANDERGSYSFSIEDAGRYFLDAGYEVAPRTISHYCQLNQFRCKKFSANGVRRWFIEKYSLDKHIAQMRHDGHAVASDSKQSQEPPKVAEKKANTNLQDTSQANASESNASLDSTQRYIMTLEKQLDEKDRQIAKLQSHNEEVANIAKGLGFLLRAPQTGDNSRSDNPRRDVE